MFKTAQRQREMTHSPGCRFLLQFQAMQPVRKPTTGALICGLIPFVVSCFTVVFWDRLDPVILGLPFNLAWLMGGCVVAGGCLWMAARFEERRDREGDSR